MNHIEAIVVDFLAELFPDIFSRSDGYCEKNRTYVDEKIGVFDREVQFYIAYLEHIATLKRAGMEFCYPHVSKTSKEIHVKETFDMALGYKLRGESSSVICNDFSLEDRERVLVVSGPNQGGKTTFARTFGQLHFMASIGCPVAGREAQLFLFDRLFTHFEKEEDITTLRGKLEDDLVRIRHILDQATPDSIIIMNEIFNSTTLRDAISLGKGIMEKIMRLDALCVCVTFVVELASLGEKTVSMVGEVSQGNPAVRTYKLLRKPADGLSYALSIAEKYHLTSDSLRKRIAS